MSASAFECKVLLSLRVTEEVQREKNFTTPFAHAHIAFETSQSSPIVTKIVKKLKAEKLVGKKLRFIPRSRCFKTTNLVLGQKHLKIVNRKRFSFRSRNFFLRKTLFGAFI